MDITFETLLRVRAVKRTTRENGRTLIRSDLDAVPHEDMTHTEMHNRFSPFQNSAGDECGASEDDLDSLLRDLETRGFGFIDVVFPNGLSGARYSVTVIPQAPEPKPEGDFFVKAPEHNPEAIRAALAKPVALTWAAALALPTGTRVVAVEPIERFQYGTMLPGMLGTVTFTEDEAATLPECFMGVRIDDHELAWCFAEFDGEIHLGPSYEDCEDQPREIWEDRSSGIALAPEGSPAEPTPEARKAWLVAHEAANEIPEAAPAPAPAPVAYQSPEVRALVAASQAAQEGLRDLLACGEPSERGDALMAALETALAPFGGAL